MMREINRKIAKVPSLENWSSRLDVGEVTRMINDLASTRGRSALSPKIRDTLLTLLTKGSPPPRHFLSDLGVTRDCFPDPERWIWDLFEKEPKKFLALLKQRIKMIDLDAIAGPISLDEKIGGRFPLPMPEQVIQEGPEKYRCIMDFSRVPDGGFPEFIEGQGPPTANKGYHKEETGCSFPTIPDKETMMMACPNGYISTNDLAGCFWQIKQHEKVLHMQIIVLWIPGWEEPRYYVLMTNAMGTAAAPASCVALHVGLIILADKYKPGILSTKDYTKPEAYGLKVDKKRKWTDFLAKEPERRVNPRKWVYLQGASRGKWKTGGKLEMYLVHIDDVNVFGKDYKTCLLRTMYLRDFYSRINLLVSPKIDPTPLQIQVVTGHEANMESNPMTIGYAEKKWEKFRESIVPLLESRDDTRFTAAHLLRAGGHFLHLAEVFFYLKPICIPFSRWLGTLNQICKQDKKLWREIMLKTTLVPRPLKTLLSKAWVTANQEVVMNVGWRLSSEVDTVRTLSTDACSQSDHDAIPYWLVKGHWHPAGFGAVDHESGTRSMFYLPEDHPLALRTIQFQEMFCAVGWILRRGQRGETIIIYVDNSCAEWWLRTFKSGDIYIALVWILADFVHENRIHLIVKRSDSKAIAADPLSRWFDEGSVGYDKKAFEQTKKDWVERASFWRIPPKGQVVRFEWLNLFERVLELEEL